MASLLYPLILSFNLCLSVAIVNCFGPMAILSLNFFHIGILSNGYILKKIILYYPFLNHDRLRFSILIYLPGG